MAYNFSPKIVTDGLVLYLDAANTRSYVSGSTTWNDISRGGNNGTLTNGPTFNSSNGGSIVFDGVNDFLTSLLNVNTYNNITFNLWYKWNGVNQFKLLSYLGDSGTNGFGFLMNDGSNGPNAGNKISVLYGGLYYNALSASATLTTSWAYLTLTRLGSTTTLYSNSTFIGSTTLTPATSVSYNFFPYGQSAITCGAAGNVAHVSFYNRALTAAEVLQNYNTTKSRFGL